VGRGATSGYLQALYLYHRHVMKSGGYRNPKARSKTAPLDATPDGCRARGWVHSR